MVMAVHRYRGFLGGDTIDVDSEGGDLEVCSRSLLWMIRSPA